MSDSARKAFEELAAIGAVVFDWGEPEGYHHDVAFIMVWRNPETSEVFADRSGHHIREECQGGQRINPKGYRQDVHEILKKHHLVTDWVSDGQVAVYNSADALGYRHFDNQELPHSDDCNSLNKLLKEVLVTRLVRVLASPAAWGIAVTALVGTITIVVTVFGPDIRQVFQSSQEKAVTQLAARGISIDVDGAANALATASVQDLELFLLAGLPKQQLSEAFSRSAQSFFERSAGDLEAEKWLERAISYGLDPNWLVPGQEYESEALLAQAMRAGNANATVVLLENGASPHPYQKLPGTPFAEPRFLFPYSYAVNNRLWSSDEKRTVVRALKEAGALYVPLDLYGESREPLPRQPMTGVARAVAEAEELLGGESLISPSACDGRLRSKLCSNFSETGERDWCSFSEQLPVRILWNTDYYDHRFLRIDIQNIINVVDSRAYFLVTDSLGPNRGYGLLEVSADLQNWNVYFHGSPGFGRGLCEPEPDGFVPDRCWRRWEISYRPEEPFVTVNRRYQYSAFDSCEVDRPD